MRIALIDTYNLRICRQKLELNRNKLEIELKGLEVVALFEDLCYWSWAFKV